MANVFCIGFFDDSNEVMIMYRDYNKAIALGLGLTESEAFWFKGVLHWLRDKFDWKIEEMVHSVIDDDVFREYVIEKSKLLAEQNANWTQEYLQQQEN